MPFLPHNQQRQSTEGSALQQMVRYFVNRAPGMLVTLQCRPMTVARMGEQCGYLDDAQRGCELVHGGPQVACCCVVSTAQQSIELRARRRIGVALHTTVVHGLGRPMGWDGAEMTMGHTF